MGNEQRQITVFGSGSIKEGSNRWKEASEVGFLLAGAGFVVVNGGYGGSMLASAKGAKAAGGRTIGVTTNEFRGSVKNEFIDREVRKRTWRVRLFELIELGDGFLFLDGGMGTLTELSVVLEVRNKGFHAKPIVILGRQMQSLVDFLKQNPEMLIPKDLYHASNPKDAVQRLVKYFRHV